MGPRPFPRVDGGEIEGVIKMKKIFLLAAFLLAVSSLSYADKSPIQLRPVVYKDDAQKIKTDKFQDPATPTHTIFISREVLLNNKDISNVLIVRSDPAKFNGLPQIILHFTPNGKQKLQAITEQYLNGRIALFFDNQLLMAPHIAAPITSGMLTIVLRDISTDESAEEFVKEAGFEPQFNR